MKRLFLSISLVFCCIYASGYYPVVKNYTKNEYKGSSKTWHITQSSCGNIWAANNSGILEFDGREWSIIEAKNKTGMRSLLFDEDSDRANTRRGTAPSDRPYSMSNTSSK